MAYWYGSASRTGYRQKQGKRTQARQYVQSGHNRPPEAVAKYFKGEMTSVYLE